MHSINNVPYIIDAADKYKNYIGSQMQKIDDDMNTITKGSTRYWYYDNNFKKDGIRKGEVIGTLTRHPDLTA